MSLQSVDVAATSVWRFSWGLIGIGAVIGLLSLWPFWDGLIMMWGWWIDTPEYSHGLLIPPVAAFLMWQQKDRLERIPFTGSWWMSLAAVGFFDPPYAWPLGPGSLLAMPSRAQSVCC